MSTTNNLATNCKNVVHGHILTDVWLPDNGSHECAGAVTIMATLGNLELPTLPSLLFLIRAMKVVPFFSGFISRTFMFFQENVLL